MWCRRTSLTKKTAAKKKKKNTKQQQQQKFLALLLPNKCSLRLQCAPHPSITSIECSHAPNHEQSQIDEKFIKSSKTEMYYYHKTEDIP